MPNDPEIRQLVTIEAQRLQADPNRPYRVRKRKEGTKTSKGTISGAEQYEFRTITNMRTQPLSDKEFNRLSEGEREQSWRFAMVIPEKVGQLPSSPDEFLDFKEEVEYKGHWFEVRKINDWDLIQSCKMVFVE
ncbi:hypothetical protein KAR91_05065 [Candidatus Pacearchaeota archaeon]|nr:hypothetical protein [Candidatus Pacearchaeota archaeon]